MTQPFRSFLFGLVLVALGCFSLKAQELNCSVSVNYSALEGADYRTRMEDMRNAIGAYLNDHAWTQDAFEDHERIDCNFQITLIESNGIDDYTAQLTVGARRPIYGTEIESNTLQLVDEGWRFQFIPTQSLIFDPNQFDPLTSVLDFYAYIILGYDYDSFADLGGTPFFNQAREIADQAQTVGGAGWSALGTDRSRGLLIREILDPRLEPLRRGQFAYHYQGLDHFLRNPDRARQSVLALLQTLQQLQQDIARTYILDQFFAVKYRELVNLFDQSGQARQAYNILVEMDPNHATEYDALNQ